MNARNSLGPVLASLAIGFVAACWTPELTMPPGWNPPGESPFEPDAPPRRDVRRSYFDRERGVVSRELFVLLYADGSLVRDGAELAWFEDGTPRLERHWDHDRPAGVWRAFWPDGAPRSAVDYGDGLTPAPLRFWHANGNLAGAGAGIDGVKEGPWTTWHANGTKKSEGSYARGLKVGVWTFWDEAERETARGAYHDGRRVGAWRLAPPDLRLDPADEDGNGQGQQPHEEGGRQGEER